MNLTAMSENQRATITHLQARNGDDAWMLGGHLDGDRVVVAGHSRGGGAALITAAANPEVLGAILIKPVDPLMAPGGEAQWSRKLPARPMLINIASDDGDTIYPICDFLFERRSSAQSAHTIIGSVHNYTLGCTEAACGPEGGDPTAHLPPAGLGHHQRLRHRLPEIRGPGRSGLRLAACSASRGCRRRCRRWACWCGATGGRRRWLSTTSRTPIRSATLWGSRRGPPASP